MRSSPAPAPDAAPWMSETSLVPAGAAIPPAPPRGGHRAEEMSPSSVNSTLAEFKKRAEASLIVQVLERNGWNLARAAAELGVSRMTLYKKLHKYGLMSA